MKCARCGNEISPTDAECPYCSGKAEPPRQESADKQEERCPFCGSHRIYAVRRGFDPCCGCLGMLLFSWVGLLLGLLGADKIEMVCRDCGSHWPFQR